MKVRARLRNHGTIDGRFFSGGDVVEIDEKQFSETWMDKLETAPEPKPKGFFKRLLRKP